MAPPVLSPVTHTVLWQIQLFYFSPTTFFLIDVCSSRGTKPSPARKIDDDAPQALSHLELVTAQVNSCFGGNLLRMA